ncbi:ULK/ULK protein kinase, variant [Aphanomyces invadans]|uniref:ULK/ULK protein kinase, variant n=1 Tax=Aphanomyces invadans TaxID=157072 RepID=A0A024UX68_9STRA|nr:ULK/ULK protein kinase, variant [Aphanomyces invadans]ETW10273.1 ULK/ULK protein kinase, variant [Aphanomyces invadans]|eukprot:XP_008861684.1 ULK/ULK protein kinase, variant [Aphanomyces invadans]
MHHQENQTPGSPHYMAPELFDPHPVHSFASDFWALGCVLYELFTGTQPFSSLGFVDLRSMIQTEPVQLPPNGINMSADFADLLRRLLEKDPADRITWHDILCHPFWGDQASRATPPSFPPQELFAKLYPMAHSPTRPQTSPTTNFDPSPIDKRSSTESHDSTSTCSNEDDAVVPMRPVTAPEAHQPTPPNNEVDMLQLDEPRHHVARLPPKTAPVQSKRRGPKPSKSSLHALKHAKARIFTTLDGSVKPIVACTSIESVAVPRIKESMLPFPIVPVESLTTQKDIEAKLEQLYNYLRGNDATVAEKHNALAYLYAMATSSKFANIIVNSSLMTLLGKLLEQSTSSALSSRLGLVLGYVVRFATFIAPDVVSDSTPGAILPILIQTLQVEHDNVQVTRRVMACVGELAFYTITQAPTRPLNPPTVQCLVRGIQDIDAIVRHYAVQTLCNILTHATDSDVVAPFVTPAVAYALMDRSLREPATQQPLQVAAIQTMAQVLKHASAPSLDGSTVVDTIFLHVARNMSIAWDHLWLAQRDYRWMIAALNVLNATLQHTAQDLSTDIPKGEFMSTICNLRSLETLGHALESREFEEDESGHIHATGRFKDGDVKLTNLVHGKLLLFLYFGLQASREFAVLFVQSNLLKVVDALLVHDAAPSSATSIYALQSAQQVVALSSRIALEVTMSLGDDRVALDVLPLFEGLVSQLLHHPQCRQVFVGILLDNVNQENECFAVGLANAIQATTEAAVKILLLVFSKHDIVSDADMANQIWFQTALFQLAAVLTSTGVTSSDVVADAIRVVNCALDVFSPAPYVDEYIVHHLLPTFHVLLHASTNDRVRRCAVEFLYNVVHHDVAFVSILYRLKLIDPILHLLVHTMCASTTKLLLLVVQSNEVPVRQVYEMGLPLLLTNAVLADDNHALVGPIGDLLELMYALLYDHLAQLRSRVASDLSNTALFAQHHPEFVRCVPRLAVLCATKRCPDDNDDAPACADKASRCLSILCQLFGDLAFKELFPREGMPSLSPLRSLMDAVTDTSNPSTRLRCLQGLKSALASQRHPPKLPVSLRQALQALATLPSTSNDDRTTASLALQICHMTE